ncbi:Hypp9174 [Branchiostoma lanceolatum]|uniref:Hypp9174 protein n=1 Tax=Branchiostoma lanceolatum TaxID=7740 RepID=A0A8J9ZC65_BRALA|nr:Hypp9174 [Branchiostoma lanceolatum]
MRATTAMLLGALSVLCAAVVVKSSIVRSSAMRDLAVWKSDGTELGDSIARQVAVLSREKRGAPGWPFWDECNSASDCTGNDGKPFYDCVQTGWTKPLKKRCMRKLCNRSSDCQNSDLQCKGGSGASDIAGLKTGFCDL